MTLWASSPSLSSRTPTLSSPPQPILDESTVLSLGEPRLHVTPLPCPPSTSPPPSSLGAVTTVPPSTSTHDGGGEGGPEEEDRRLVDAVAAAAAFRRVSTQAAAAAAGGLFSNNGGGSNAVEAEGSAQQPPQPYGLCRPFLAPVLTNRRITREDHFQDVR